MRGREGEVGWWGHDWEQGGVRREAGQGEVKVLRWDCLLMIIHLFKHLIIFQVTY